MNPPLTFSQALPLNDGLTGRDVCSGNQELCPKDCHFLWFTDVEEIKATIQKHGLFHCNRLSCATSSHISIIAPASKNHNCLTTIHAWYCARCLNDQKKYTISTPTMHSAFKSNVILPV